MRKPDAAILVSVLLLLLPAAAAAQVHPNLEKGFSADKMYEFHDIDHVNLFNGNLTLTVPLGGGTAISDHLSLSFTLVYNSKIWEATTAPDYGYQDPGEQIRTLKTPSARSNAGLGWMLSAGRLFQGSTSNLPSGQNDSDIITDSLIHYESPDGSDHVFYYNLHGEENSGFYTKDGSYIRMTDGNPRLIETPDGTVREFTSWMDGTRQRWRLTRIRDAFGNHADFDYATTRQWTITDQYGRVITVHFKDVVGSDSAVWNATPAYATAVDYVDVPKPGSGTARYQFTYEDRWVRTGYCGQDDLNGRFHNSDFYKVPLLTNLSLPDGSAYHFDYTSGTAVEGAGPETLVDPGDCSGGSLTSTTLPTSGKISWAYTAYEMPTAGCLYDSLALSAGVATRTLHDPITEAADGVWTYAQNAAPESDAFWECARGQGISYYAPAEESITIVIDPALNRTKYHFSVWPVDHGVSANRPDGATFLEYGLPFSHKTSAVDGKFLSTESYQKTDGGESLARSTYVKYERDGAGFAGHDSNHRLSGSRTVFNDDGSHYIDVAYSDNDGLGHYRTVKTSGDFLGSGTERFVTIDYNRRSALVGSSIFDTGTYDPSGIANTFTRPPTNLPWITGLYTRVVTTEGSSAAVQEACFDPSTGFLNGTRTYAGISRAANDLVASFATGTAANGTIGAVTEEKYYGGDINLLTAAPDATLCGLLASPGALGYDIRHSYDHGARKTSEYFSGGTTIGFKFLDQDIDANTGLSSVSRDTAGVATSYAYDSSRRLTIAQTSTDPPITYAYTNASGGTGATGASATISQASATSGTPQAAFQFDGFGRLVLHSSSLPSTTPGVPRWSRQKTVFDSMGRKIKVSESEESSTQSHFTIFSDFDAFGRAQTVTKPDGSKTLAQYSGSRRIDRTAFIHTQSGLDTAAVTSELYDVNGRLYDVVEPGNGLHASYTYDIGNRLHTASVAGEGVTQTRTFNYDNRGFLLSETHPELGAEGTIYSMYDARGHAHHNRSGPQNSIYDLSLTYDSSERLIYVYDQNGARELKHFVFAPGNDVNVSPPSYERGKLSQAVRTNHLATGGVVVTETYKYQYPSGRISSRKTDVTSGATTLQSFTQPFSYDDLGEITAPGYPTCPVTPCGTGMPAGAAFTYKDGSLIAIPGYASSISYSGNMLSQVTHQHGDTDTYAQDATNGLPRPSSITFAGTSCPAPSAPVITAAASVPANSTNNQASVDDTLQYSWSITGGTITSTTSNSIVYTAGASGTIVLSVTATNQCGTGPVGSRNVLIQGTLSPPLNFSATTQSNSSIVTLTWSQGVSGPTSYRMERRDCYNCSWTVVGPNPTTATSYNDTLTSGSMPAAHLYHVIAIASGSGDSAPSAADYAVTAATLFAENIVATTPQVTGPPVRGAHVLELRKAIDALRGLANLPAYWTDYSAPTGTVLASHQTDMRTAIDQAVFSLLSYHLTFTGPTPAHDGGIFADQMNQLRTAVK